MAYTGKLNWFMPPAAIPALAWVATCAETLLGVALVLGVFTRVAAFLSGWLLLLFALSMTLRICRVRVLSKKERSGSNEEKRQNQSASQISHIYASIPRGRSIHALSTMKRVPATTLLATRPGADDYWTTSAG